jgi:hypothetical protein
MAVLKRLETDGPATYLLSSRSDHGYNAVLATDAMTDRDGTHTATASTRFFRGSAKSTPPTTCWRD